LAFKTNTASALLTLSDGIAKSKKLGSLISFTLSEEEQLTLQPLPKNPVIRFLILMGVPRLSLIEPFIRNAIFNMFLYHGQG
jgi:hypothetical protein